MTIDVIAHIGIGMGSKNISISEEAYSLLRRARRHPRESFSQVISRGRWDEQTPSARSWLDAFSEAPVVSEEVLNRWEIDQMEDRPPEDKWSC